MLYHHANAEGALVEKITQNLVSQRRELREPTSFQQSSVCWDCGAYLARFCDYE